MSPQRGDVLLLLTHSLAEERALGEGGDALHAVAAHAGAGVSTDHAQRQKVWRQVQH